MWLFEITLQPLRTQIGNFRVEHHIKVCIGQFSDISNRSRERGHHIDVDTYVGQQFTNFSQVIAMSKTQCGGS